MSTYFEIRHPALTRPINEGVVRRKSRFLELASAILSWPARIHENRALLRSMADMTEGQLSDIGLSRQDLIDTSALSMRSDVGAFLATRAGDRRRARH